MPGTAPDVRLLAALKAYRRGDVAAARAALQALLAEQPDHADALEVLGKILEEQGELDEAIRLTERLVALQPESIMAHANLSRFWMLKGDKETAEEWQAKARVLGWKDEVARKGAAGGTAPTERPVDPDTVLRQEQAVERDPDSVVARLALARSYRKLDMPIKAVVHLRAALERDPRMSVLYLQLGQALEAANLGRDAVPVYEAGIPLAEANGDLMPRNQMATRLAALRKRASGG